LQEITYKMELILDVKQAKDTARDLSKSIAESFGDALTHTLALNNSDTPSSKGVAALWAEQAQAEADMYESYLKEYNALSDLLANANEYTDTDAIIDELLNLQSEISNSVETILEWIEYLEDLIPEAIDAAAERLAIFTD
jgi:hypothetical protein